MRSKSSVRLIAALAAAVVIPATAAGQSGWLDAPRRGTVVTGQTDLRAVNNTLAFTDAWAVAQLASDPRFADIFLVGGLVPEGAGFGATALGHSRMSLTHTGARWRIGVEAGLRSESGADVTDAVARFARVGFDGEPFSIALNGTGFRAVHFGEAALRVARIFGDPLRPRWSIGAGARVVKPVGMARLGFDDPVAGGAVSTVTWHAADSTSIDATLTQSIEPFAGGRMSVSPEFIAGARIGHAGWLALGVAAPTTLLVATGDREVRRLRRDGSAVDLVDALENAPTDTIQSASERVVLPAVATLKLALPIGGRATLHSSLRLSGRSEWNPEPTRFESSIALPATSWLELSGGGFAGSRYGGGALVGGALSFWRTRLFGEARLTGGATPGAVRGLQLSGGASLRF